MVGKGHILIFSLLFMPLIGGEKGTKARNILRSCSSTDDFFKSRSIDEQDIIAATIEKAYVEALEHEPDEVRKRNFSEKSYLQSIIVHALVLLRLKNESENKLRASSNEDESYFENIVVQSRASDEQDSEYIINLPDNYAAAFMRLMQFNRERIKNGNEVIPPHLAFMFVEHYFKVAELQPPSKCCALV